MNQTREVSIYVLRDADGSPVYVGQTTNVKRRLWHHWRKNRFPDTASDRRLDQWLVSLTEKPTLDVIEVVPYEIRFAVEREWMLALRVAGYDLLNIATGSSISPETAAKMSDANRGRKLTEEHKAAISSGLRGEGTIKPPVEKRPRTLSQEHREKLLAANRGRTRSDETRAQIAETLRGHVVSEETRRKIGEAARGRTPSAETRVKIGAAHRGKPKSEETKRRMSEAHRGKKMSEEAKAKMRAAQQRRREREQRNDEGRSERESV